MKLPAFGGLLALTLIGCGEVEPTPQKIQVQLSQSEKASSRTISPEVMTVLENHYYEISKLRSELSETRKANADQEQRLINVESYLRRSTSANGTSQNFKDFVEEVR